MAKFNIDKDNFICKSNFKELFKQKWKKSFYLILIPNDDVIKYK